MFDPAMLGTPPAAPKKDGELKKMLEVRVAYVLDKGEGFGPDNRYQSRQLLLAFPKETTPAGGQATLEVTVQGVRAAIDIEAAGGIGQAVVGLVRENMSPAMARHIVGVREIGRLQGQDGQFIADAYVADLGVISAQDEAQLCDTISVTESVKGAVLFAQPTQANSIGEGKWFDPEIKAKLDSGGFSGLGGLYQQAVDRDRPIAELVSKAVDTRIEEQARERQNFKVTPQVVERIGHPFPGSPKLPYLTMDQQYQGVLQKAKRINQLLGVPDSASPASRLIKRVSTANVIATPSARNLFPPAANIAGLEARLVRAEKSRATLTPGSKKTPLYEKILKELERKYENDRGQFLGQELRKNLLKHFGYDTTVNAEEARARYLEDQRYNRVERWLAEVRGQSAAKLDFLSDDFIHRSEIQGVNLSELVGLDDVKLRRELGRIWDNQVREVALRRAGHLQDLFEGKNESYLLTRDFYGNDDWLDKVKIWRSVEEKWSDYFNQRVADEFWKQSALERFDRSSEKIKEKIRKAFPLFTDSQVDQHFLLQRRELELLFDDLHQSIDDLMKEQREKIPENVWKDSPEAQKRVAAQKKAVLDRYMNECRLRDMMDWMSNDLSKRGNRVLQGAGASNDLESRCYNIGMNFFRNAIRSLDSSDTMGQSNHLLEAIQLFLKLIFGLVSYIKTGMWLHNDSRADFVTYKIGSDPTFVKDARKMMANYMRFDPPGDKKGKRVLDFSELRFDEAKNGKSIHLCLAAAAIAKWQHGVVDIKPPKGVSNWEKDLDDLCERLDESQRILDKERGFNQGDVHPAAFKPHVQRGEDPHGRALDVGLNNQEPRALDLALDLGIADPADVADADVGPRLRRNSDDSTDSLVLPGPGN